MDFIAQYKPLVEFLYLLSGPLMLLGLLIAILQLIFYRREAKDRFERETIINSMNILHSKLKDICKHISELKNLDSYHDVPEFEGEIKSLHRAGINCTNECLAKYNDDDNYEYYNIICDILNELETLSQYVLSGITNEELCYKLEGANYLEIVEDYKPFLAFEIEKEDDVFYENLKTLYQLWSEKRSHDITFNEHKKLSSNLKSFKRPKSLKVVGE